MKIFNWVHRKLIGQPSSVALHLPKDDMNMSQLINIEKEVKSGDEGREALLGWRDEILAIGTLGLHTDRYPFPDYIMIPDVKVFDYPKDRVKDVENLDEPMLIEEEDDRPLVFNTYSNHEIEEVDENQIVSTVKTEEFKDVKDVKGDRVTLADLFKAEAVVSQKCVSKSVSVLKENNMKSSEKIGKQKKFPSSFSVKLVKKLIPNHEAKPIKKINHMMKKMLKSKIHPELFRQKSASEIILENQNQVSSEVQGPKGMALLHSAELVASK